MTPRVDKTCDRNRLGCEEQFLEQVYAGDLDEIEGSVDVVRNAELGGSDGEGGILRCNDHIAAEHELAGAAPDRSFDHGDHGVGAVVDLTHHLAKGIVVGKRIAAVSGQLSNIVPRGKDLGAFYCSQKVTRTDADSRESRAITMSSRRTLLRALTFPWFMVITPIWLSIMEYGFRGWEAFTCRLRATG